MKVLSLGLLALAASLPAQGRKHEPRVVCAGDWRVEVHYEVASKTSRRAVAYRQEVLRFAPGAREGERIHVETSTGRTRVFLRDDGLCFVDPVQREPFLSFVGGQELAYPLGLNKDTGPATWNDLHANSGGRVHFLGDVCVVVRRYRTWLQIASFEVDVEQRTATPLQEILEDDGEGWSENVKAAMPDRLMLRIGDLLLWANTGAAGGFAPKSVEPRWRPRRLHVYCLDKRAFVELDSIDYAMFREHRERIVTFVERQCHNAVPEFEMWAVERLGAWGFVNYTDRLIRLLASAEPWGVGEALEWNLRKRRAVYLEALTKLNGR